MPRECPFRRCDDDLVAAIDQHRHDAVGAEEAGGIACHLLDDPLLLQRFGEDVSQFAEREDLGDPALQLGAGIVPLLLDRLQLPVERALFDHQHAEARGERNQEEPPAGEPGGGDYEEFNGSKGEPDGRCEHHRRNAAAAAALQLPSPADRRAIRSVTYASGGALGLTRTDLAGMPTLTCQARTSLVATAEAPTIPFCPTRTPARTVA